MRRFFSLPVLSILGLLWIALSQTWFAERANQRARLFQEAAETAQVTTVKSLKLNQELIDQRNADAEKMAKILSVMTLYGYSCGQDGVPTMTFFTNACELLEELKNATNVDFDIVLERVAITNEVFDSRRRL